MHMQQFCKAEVKIQSFEFGRGGNIYTIEISKPYK